MDKNTLQKVGEWAHSRVASGEEPPWTFHKLKLLAELATELSDGLEAGIAYTPGLVCDEEKSVAALDNVVEISGFKVKEEDPFANLPA